ncbi:MAG: ABC transporter substrate-binding protein [Rhodobacteraceae bacterium]|nr:ABC transporter substrate-binding protein [Paracoccaceae bacterium]
MVWLSILFAAVLLAPPIDAKTFRLGTTVLPEARGNPYKTTATTPYIFFTALFDPLVVIDNEGAMHPGLATSWEPVNPTTWHFHLRPGVTFSNGEPFNAEAVKVTLDFLISDAAIAQSVARDVEFISGARVIDDLTVEITTRAPEIFLPRYLAGINIVAPRHFTELGLDGFALDPIGTGPFKVDDWGPERALLSAFTDSWRAPKVDALEVLALPEATARLQALQTRRVDVATNINIDHIPALEADGFMISPRNPTRVMIIAFDTVSENSPFRDVRVRQAVNYAVNRQAIVDGLLGGLTKPASGPAAPGEVGYDPDLKPYPYDPDRARALLAEAGYADGFSFVKEGPTGQLAADAAVAQQVAADLARVGINMEVRNVTLGQIIKYMTVGGWKGLAISTDFSTAPSLDAMRSFNRHTCSWPAKWFCDPEIQGLIDEARATFDAERRTELTRQIVRRYHDVASSLFLYPAVSVEGVNPRVRNWAPWNDNFRYDILDVDEN